MSEAVDTSAEAVERSVEELLGWITGPDSGHNDGVVEAVKLIRALSAASAQLERERDALRQIGKKLLAMAAGREYSVSIGRHLAEHLEWPDDAPAAVHVTLEEARAALATPAQEPGL